MLPPTLLLSPGFPFFMRRMRATMRATALASLNRCSQAENSGVWTHPGHGSGIVVHGLQAVKGDLVCSIGKSAAIARNSLRGAYRRDGQFVADLVAYFLLKRRQTFHSSIIAYSRLAIKPSTNSIRSLSAAFTSLIDLEIADVSISVCTARNPDLRGTFSTVAAHAWRLDAFRL